MNYKDLIDKEGARITDRVIDTYDDGGREYTAKYYNTYRRTALQDGLQIMVRNFFKMVVDKSGMLWNSKAPVLEVYEQGQEQPDDVQSVVAKSIFEKAQYVEFFTNLDPMLRALKTVYVLVQFDPEKKRWAFDMLHQDNSFVKLDAFGDLELAGVRIGKSQQGKIS